MTLNNIVSPQTIKAHEHFNHKNIYLRNPISQGTWKYNSIYQINLPWNCSTAHWSLGVLWSILEITDLSSFHSGVRILNNQRQQLTSAVHWIISWSVSGKANSLASFVDIWRKTCFKNFLFATFLLSLLPGVAISLPVLSLHCAGRWTVSKFYCVISPSA